MGVQCGDIGWKTYSLRSSSTPTMYSAVLLLSALFVAVNGAPISEDGDLSKIEYFGNNVGEEGEHFEGDMLLTPAQHRALYDASLQRNGLTNTTKRWPDATVVYYIEEDDFDEDQVKMIEEGMEDIANKSCIKFVPRKSEDEQAVKIRGSTNACSSTVGFSTPDDDGNIHQVLNLAKGCFRHGTIVHEMLHTLGFYHMHSSYDRDEFVKIVWENIVDAARHNFEKYTKDSVSDFGVTYDYNSVMHYPSTAFSKNGEKTIITLKEDVTIGQRIGLSKGDILKLNRMYCEQK